MFYIEVREKWLGKDKDNIIHIKPMRQQAGML